MKKIIVILSLSFLGFNLSGEPLTPEEIKNMQRGIAPHILNICNKKSKCFEKEFNKFKKSLVLAQIKHGRIFFDKCYSRYIQIPVKSKLSPDINSYNICNNRYFEGLTRDSFDKSLNHLFLGDDSVTNMILRVCKSKYNLLEQELLNNCIERQREHSRVIVMYFLHPRTIKFDKNIFKNCLNENKKEDLNERVGINFLETRSCLNRRIKNV